MTASRICLIAAALASIAPPSTAVASCSLFDDAPCVCVPSFCSVESGDPCQPDLAYGPQDIVEIVVHSGASGAEPAALNSSEDATRFLRGSWKPPEGVAFDGILMDVSFAFDRSGALRSTPNIAFFSPDAPQATQTLFGQTVREAILRCTPLPFSATFGRNMQGHLLAVRFVVDQKTR
jgi:hypothetical protein